MSEQPFSGSTLLTLHGEGARKGALNIVCFKLLAWKTASRGPHHLAVEQLDNIDLEHGMLEPYLTKIKTDPNEELPLSPGSSKDLI